MQRSFVMRQAVLRRCNRVFFSSFRIAIFISEGAFNRLRHTSKHTALGGAFIACLDTFSVSEATPFTLRPLKIREFSRTHAKHMPFRRTPIFERTEPLVHSLVMYTQARICSHTASSSYRHPDQSHCQGTDATGTSSTKVQMSSLFCIEAGFCRRDKRVRCCSQPGG